MIKESFIDLVSNKSVKPEFKAEIVTGLNKWFPIYEINTPKRYCAFIAQCAHETGGFLFFKELGGKDYCERYEPDTTIGKSLGNTEKGDGYRYKGRGIIQLTGRGNYSYYGKLIGENLIDDPDLLLIPDNAVHVACEYWKQNNLNKHSDECDIIKITRKINGGLNGLQEREKFYNLLIENIDLNNE